MASSHKPSKKGCQWLWLSHDLISYREFMDSWGSLTKQIPVAFKFEAGILHVQCRKLSDAKKLVNKTNSDMLKYCLCIYDTY